MAVLVGGAVHGASRLRGRGLDIAAAASVVVVLALLAALTWRQAGVYRDEIAFFSHIVSLNPAARGAYRNLGGALLDTGRSDEAVAVLRIATERSPDAAGVRADLGSALAAQERFEEAAEQFRHALELDPRNLNAL